MSYTSTTRGRVNRWVNGGEPAASSCLFTNHNLRGGRLVSPGGKTIKPFDSL